MTTNGAGVWAARLTEAGDFIGTRLRINTDVTTTDQINPAVAFSSYEYTGNTVIFAWEDYRNSPGNPDIYARYINWEELTAYPGDLNLDGSIDISDLTFLIDYLFREGPEPPAMSTADFDQNGSVNVADITALVNYLFF